jgi:uncharacterized Rmd1/YagE family protein
VVAASPLILRLACGGFVALFAYGTVVLVGVSPADEQIILQKLNDRIEGPLDAPVVVGSQLQIGPNDAIMENCIMVKDASAARLIVVADSLAKDVALAFEEQETGKVLAMLEPFAGDLARFGRLPRPRRKMLRIVGQALLTHHRLFEQVDVEEGPDLLTNNLHEGEHLHHQLTTALHFKKRTKALSRKIDAIEVMTQALTELIDAQREIRLEWLIVILIVADMGMYLYDLFFRAG